MSVVAAIQMCSNDRLEDNLRAAETAIRAAASDGAKLIVLPENFAFMGGSDAQRLEVAEPASDGPIQRFLAELSAALGVWIVGGSVPLAARDTGRVAAACLVYDAQGELRTRYDKIHLFDVAIPGGSESYLESASTQAGEHVRVLETPVGRVGLAICYDLRFPELFRAMLARGMQLISLPAAFTATTGAAHWELLLRARAVENLCYVVAAAQTGEHPGGRRTHGHTMIVDPWGTILSEIVDGSGIALASIDLQRLGSIRSSFPALAHRRVACAPESDTAGEPSSP